MPLIDRPHSAIAAIKAPVVRIRVTLKIKGAAGVGGAPRVADAMGPGVVRADRDATRGATLDGKDDAVIAGRTAGVGMNDGAIKLSRQRILET